MAGLSRKTAIRAGATLPPLFLALLLLSGCNEDSYPTDLNYPLRSDPIVLQLPEKPITQLDEPGRLEQWIDTIPNRGGKLLDPRAMVEKRQLAQVNEYLSKSHFDLTDEEAREVGLPGKPSDKDTAKKDLETRRDALKKRVDTIDKTMATASPQINKSLIELFGTPAQPKVDLDDKLAADWFDEGKLADGSRLYRRHCLHCHGLTGDGRGPTGPWVNPHPRDYRQGEFKFTSSAVGTGIRKARREDLLATLKRGVEGTSMPTFALLDEQNELEPLVSYVIHLSLRGQVELELIKALIGGDSEGMSAEDLSDLAHDKLAATWKNWKATEAKPVKVGDAPSYTGKPANQLSPEERKDLDKSIQRGFNQFVTGTAQCRSCHNDFGRANDFKYDDWGTIVRPANLTQGIYRGGRRPLDLYYRMYSGINGSRMPAFDSALQPQDIWDIVNFLEALPYKQMLPEDVREQVYGNKK